MTEECAERFYLCGGEHFFVVRTTELTHAEHSAPVVRDSGEVLPPLALSIAELAILQALVIESSGLPEPFIAANDRPLLSPKDIANITFNAELGCWEKPVYKDGTDTFPGTNIKRARYGQIHNRDSFDKVPMLAHRGLYMQFVGHPGSNLLDHLCDNKRCCYPRHLEPVTAAINNQRAVRRRKVVPGQLTFEVE